jgi:hypothetical protein
MAPAGELAGMKGVALPRELKPAERKGAQGGTAKAVP